MYQLLLQNSCINAKTHSLNFDSLSVASLCVEVHWPTKGLWFALHLRLVYSKLIEKMVNKVIIHYIYIVISTWLRDKFFSSRYFLIHEGNVRFPGFVNICNIPLYYSLAP